MKLTITALEGVPQLRPGDDLPAVLIAALERGALAPRQRDILVVTQKVVSKAEGRYLDLSSIKPSPKARELAALTGKDPHLVEAILSQSAEVLRARAGVLITATHHGSNLEPEDSGKRVLLLPRDPDASAARIKERVDAHFRTEIGVIVSDSAGRAWRLGTIGLAIGAAGRYTWSALDGCGPARR